MSRAAEKPDTTPVFSEPDAAAGNEAPQPILDGARLAVSSVVGESPDEYGWQAPTHGNVELNPNACDDLFKSPNLSRRRSISNMVTGHDLPSRDTDNNSPANEQSLT